MATRGRRSAPAPAPTGQRQTGGSDPTRVLSQFNLAFSLMSIIPLLICLYLITAKFFTLEILAGLNGVYILLAVIIALLGLLAGRQVIREIFRHLVEANAKLQRLYDQQAGFVGNVAHEFRAPLAVFKGAIDNLADGLHGDLTEDQQNPVQMCQREVNRLTRLVRDLLDLTRIEAGRMPMARQDLALQDILRATTDVFSHVAKERGLSVNVELPQAPAIIVGDRDRLQQVFTNLLTNALKFTPAGDISIRLLRDDTAYRVEIEDTGRGIAEEDLERIFDKFERVGDPSEEGAGLGLPIAKDIVELHQGRIWVESRLGRGSRFIVRLPAKGSVR